MPGIALGTITSRKRRHGDLLAAFGVVNLGARVYDPVIGRFLSRDPIIQAKSPYAFADNDPINKIDPTGMVVSCEASNSVQSDASCYSKADQTGSSSGSSVAGESQSGWGCSGYDAGGGTQVINCQLQTSCDTFCQWDKLLADSFPLIPGVGGTNQTGGALGQLRTAAQLSRSHSHPFLVVAGRALPPLLCADRAPLSGRRVWLPSDRDLVSLRVRLCRPHVPAHIGAWLDVGRAHCL